MTECFLLEGEKSVVPFFFPARIIEWFDLNRANDDEEMPRG